MDGSQGGSEEAKHDDCGERRHKTGIHTLVLLGKHVVVLSAQDAGKGVPAEDHVGVEEEAAAIQQKDLADDALLGVHFLLEHVRAEEGGSGPHSASQGGDVEKRDGKTLLLQFLRETKCGIEYNVGTDFNRDYD